MKKKTLSTVISIISILLIFSSLSYAATASEWVKAHNDRRYWHGAPNVTWDNTLAAQAKYDADHWDGSHAHPGQNYSSCKSCSAESVVASWYSEEQYYDYNNPGFSQDTGHFTQVVWKGSTKIGCATGTGGTICNYKPYGNVYGQFKENVGPNFLPVFIALMQNWFKLFPLITIP